jgi:serine protease Do
MASDENLLSSLDMTDSAAAIRDVVKCVRDHPYVVAVAPAPPTPAPAPAPPAAVSSGTGFFVSSEGHILTNHHVVEGCRYITASKGGRITRFASDEASDLALLMSSEKPRYWASLREVKVQGLLKPLWRLGFP